MADVPGPGPRFDSKLWLETLRLLEELDPEGYEDVASKIKEACLKAGIKLPIERGSA